MSGGNISGGPKEASGKGTAPKEVGGYGDTEAKISRQLKTIDYLEKQVQRQKDANNLLSDKVRALAKEAQEKLDVIREMYKTQTDDLIAARLMADKYLEKFNALQEEVDAA